MFIRAALVGVRVVTLCLGLASHGRADHFGPGFERQQTAHAERALVGAAETCERIDPENEALYRKVAHECVAAILGGRSERVAEDREPRQLGGRE